MNGIELGGVKGPWRVSGWIVYAGEARVATVQNIGPKGEAIARAIAEVPAMVQALRQYRDDMRYPPSADSRLRRISMIEAILDRLNGEF